jgi:sialate O-acetylesterase
MRVMNRLRVAPLLSLLICGLVSAEVTVPPIFGDHMVLQRGIEVPVWGKANPNERVTVEVNGVTGSAAADKEGNWMVRLQPLAAPARAEDPVQMTIKGETGQPIVLRDVLVGDVWTCSGQSNMEWPVSRSANPDESIASATDPKIRLFRFHHTVSEEPTKTVVGEWEVCSPETVGDFGAVGYFFGRDVRRMTNAPVGLIQNSWGGMPAEAFTSAETLASDPAFKVLLDRKAKARETLDADRAAFREKLAAWEKDYLAQDVGISDESWAAADFDDASWGDMTLPAAWESAGLKIDGAVWFRRAVDVPSELAGEDMMLSLGTIDDFDAAYVNGSKVGSVGDENALAPLVKRDYRVPGKLVKAGRNVIAVRVFDQHGNGGFTGRPSQMTFAPAGPQALAPIPLNGEWKYKVEKAIEPNEKVPPRPREPLGSKAPNMASNLFNGMVNPVIPYAIKGVIWYQGESNAGRAEQYRKLFPAMITDWRKQWGQGDFPFLFVQLANFKARAPEPGESDWAELREAQSMALKLPNTAMAVTIDIGEEKDIHPKNKQDVGLRLARAAEHVAYGKELVYSGPNYESMRVEGDKARLTFRHVGSGLEAKGGALKGFAVAGADKKFVWADATIDGNEVVVSAKGVDKPIAVRYAWADNPEATLYNADGLPASPFRTDDWKGITAGKE